MSSERNQTHTSVKEKHDATWFVEKVGVLIDLFGSGKNLDVVKEQMTLSETFTDDDWTVLLEAVATFGRIPYEKQKLAKEESIEGKSDADRLQSSGLFGRSTTPSTMRPGSDNVDSGAKDDGEWVIVDDGDVVAADIEVTSLHQ